MKYIRDKINLFYPRFKHTCRNLSVHGPSFLARRDIHFVYRLIYFIIYIHVWIAAVASIYKYISTYQEDTIRFVTRTDYLYWNTTFPSVTICENVDSEKISKKLQKLGQEAEEENVALSKEIAFFTGECRSCNLNHEKNSTMRKELFSLANEVRAGCKDLFLSCTWDGKPMNCCTYFKPIQTEYGLCFSINNNQISDNQAQIIVATSNSRKLGTLELLLSEEFEAFLHSPEDVPYWNIEEDRRLITRYGSSGSILFSITEIVNEPEVSLTAPDVRQCRFPDEMPDNFKGYKYYSYSVCIIQCRIEAQLELCNCTSHLSPVEYKDRYCDLEGLNCLTKHFNTLKQLKVPGVKENGLKCNCLSSCTESEYDVIAKKVTAPEVEINGAAIKFLLSNRPFEKVTRQVARTALDLVVAMGNCFGLCFGGSLLSIVEVLYYVCFKQWKYSNVI